VFERILLAVDGSAPSRRAKEAEAELAASDGAEVLVLHVRELDPRGAQARSHWRSRAKRQTSALLAGSVAHNVIHHAECPVLVTRQDVRRTTELNGNGANRAHRPGCCARS
jgi:nucleotide-binding universal stress UspA family protein